MGRPEDTETAEDGGADADERWRAEAAAEARGEIDRQHRIAEARQEVERAYARQDEHAAQASEAQGEAAEVDWPSEEIREDDWDSLRQLERDGSRFSEPRMMWVRVDDPRLESTEEVGGEPFQGGESPEAYQHELAELWERREQHPEVADVDSRHTGLYKMRIEETPDGELDVVNGRHRVQAAREAGVPAVLAEAVAFRGDEGSEPRSREPKIP